MAIHSQVLNCSASEVAAMIEGVMRQGTSMNVEGNYVDSHGQSEIGFAITRLLGFEPLARIKQINAALVYINTLMIQDILAEPAWAGTLTDEDKRGVNPLFTSNMTPYGEVKINMTSRLDLSHPTPPEPDLDALAA